MKNTDYANEDKKFMGVALELAKKGIGRVSPNPLVGCVIVKNGKIIGSGFHKYFGGPHAEIEAIMDCHLADSAGRNNMKGATMYVNLEPCCHYNKKTPPCVPEIVKAGIKKVAIGMKDPNPQVNGKGIQALKVNGVKCKVGILEEEAKELNKFYIKYIAKKIPYVILKSAMSIDGKIATKTGDAKWISSVEARKYSYKLRSQIDAICVGIGTVITDNPSLTAHGFVGDLLGRNPKRIVIDTKLRIPLNSKILNSSETYQEAETILATTENCNKSKLKILKLRNVSILILPEKNGKVSLKNLLVELGKMGISSLLVEGGGEISSSFIKEKLVDEIMFFISPKIIGGRDAKTPVEGNGINKIKDAINLENIKIKKIGNDFLIRGDINARL